MDMQEPRTYSPQPRSRKAYLWIAILTVALDSGRKQGYWDTGSGKDTQDRVFLLSYAEAAWARLQDSIISQRI